MENSREKVIVRFKIALERNFSIKKLKRTLESGFLVNFREGSFWNEKILSSPFGAMKVRWERLYP